MPTPYIVIAENIYSDPVQLEDPVALSPGWEHGGNVVGEHGAGDIHATQYGQDNATPINPWTNPHARAAKAADQVSLVEARRI